MGRGALGRGSELAAFDITVEVVVSTVDTLQCPLLGTVGSAGPRGAVSVGAEGRPSKGFQQVLRNS